MAYEIFDFDSAFRVSDGERVPFDAVPNSSGPDRRRPRTGCVLIWHPRGYFRHTGHVAIVTEATDTYVRIAEQNTHDRYWQEGTDYSRELVAQIDPSTGAYTILDTTASGAKVCGWMFVGLDDTVSPPPPPPIANEVEPIPSRAATAATAATAAATSSPGLGAATVVEAVSISTTAAAKP
jgi:glutathionylspermidine amidase/synthetase